MNNELVVLSSEVAEALGRRRPVVALESTLISHGLPWPDNLETALEAQAAVEQGGATPATVAVLGGRIRVGLARSDLERLARSGTFHKAGRRDLAAAVAGRLDAATTVSATLWIARKSGVRIMATGGLGGVHRGAAESFDVSNDLDELARADGVLVVCSGVKSILDVPATLEALDTRGVVVAGYRTDTFPAFTTASSGLPLDLRMDDPRQCADLLKAHRDLGLPGAIVLAQPVAAEVALDRDEMEAALTAALAEAATRRISGKALTPFLLDHIRRATEGRSLLANRALVVANARLAAEVAAVVGDAEGTEGRGKASELK